MHKFNLRNKLKSNLTLYHFYLEVKNKLNEFIFTDEQFYSRFYKKTHGEYPNLDHPKTFSEKIVWSLIYHRNPLYIKLADKYAVRSYVEKAIGAKYLIKCYGIYSKAEEIDYSKLPNSFVMKATHGSGWNLIVPDKSELNIKKANRKIKYWLSHNFFGANREWPYKFMPHRVICEEYIYGEDGNPPMDYKIFCFNGVPKLIQLDIGRFNSHHRNLYDLHWNQIQNVEIAHNQDYRNEYPRPSNLDQMLELAAILSQGFEHVRIDLYTVKDQIFFGEMTFFHGAGVFEYFRPKQFHIKVGSWFNLPTKNKDSWNLSKIEL